MQKHLIFRISETRFALDVDKVIDVMNPGGLDVLPEMPDFVVGLKDVRGEMIPIVDMRDRMGVSPSTKRERMLTINVDGDKVGLIVDEVIAVQLINTDDVRRPPVLFRGLKKKFMDGLCGQKDEVIVLLKIEKLLTLDEAVALKVARKGKS
jgi:purine-binding chemotaxis protein CheW